MGSSKPHYFAIGVFVLVATALGLAGVVLLSADALRSPERFIETYVDESVQGIDVGTPFKLRGVKVGSVSKIAMVSTTYDTAKMYVMIRIALDGEMLQVDQSTFEAQVAEQVELGLRLKLVPQGITGLSFVEADLFPDARTDPLEMDWTPLCTYIPSTPATMTLLSRSIERLSAELDTINISGIGENIDELTGNLNASVAYIEQILGNVASVSGQVVTNVHSASVDLPTITANLNNTILEMEGIVGSSDRDIDQILSNLRYITDDARELIRQLKRHPGMLLAEPPENALMP